MDTEVLKNMIAVIRTEQERRTSLLNSKDPNLACDQWMFTAGPFLSELCLMFLVTLRHQVERELVALAAQADDNGEEISGLRFKQKVEQLKLRKKIGWDWKSICKRLKLKSCKKYEFIEVLRLLSNLYKHEFSMEPDEKLLKKLKINTGVKYAPLPESDALREGLANFLGIGNDADCCDIAEQFVDIASEFLAQVESRTNLSQVKWSAVSLNPNDFAR